MHGGIRARRDPEPHKRLSLSEKADAILNELAELRIAVLQEIRTNQCSCTVQ